jgi:predicted enzyme related to lactoylglutathione lyase
MKNAINWFEIPVTDFERAKGFYEEVLQTEMPVMEMETPKALYAFFPFDMENGGIGGGIIKGQGYEPAQTGSLIYLNGGNDLSVPLSRVEPAGGKIMLPKTSIGKNGFIAHFTDTEGNKVAFHSMT